MYRKYDIESLIQTKTWFFKTIQKLLKKKRIDSLKIYLRELVKTWNRAYYFERSHPVLSIRYEWWWEFSFFDEKERIQLLVKWDSLDKLHSLTKDIKKVEKQERIWKKIDDLLREDFSAWTIPLPNWKPYIVYDIETNLAGRDLSKTIFYLWYAYVVRENGVGTYKYIDQENLEKFVQYMLWFDGYIVWYNNIYFDNPVSVYNVPNWTQEMIEALNKKSLDIFQFLQQLTGKRVGLNKVANALVWVTKTLESWAEWESLMQQYKETWDESFLRTFKKYCKNDVEMTVLTFFYFLKNTIVHLDDQEFVYTIDDFLTLANQLSNAWDKNTQETSMFD